MPSASGSSSRSTPAFSALSHRGATGTDEDSKRERHWIPSEKHAARLRPVEKPMTPSKGPRSSRTIPDHRWRTKMEDGICRVEEGVVIRILEQGSDAYLLQLAALRVLNIAIGPE